MVLLFIWSTGVAYWCTGVQLQVSVHESILSSTLFNLLDLKRQLSKQFTKLFKLTQNWKITLAVMDRQLKKQSTVFKLQFLNAKNNTVFNTKKTCSHFLKTEGCPCQWVCVHAAVL